LDYFPITSWFDSFSSLAYLSFDRFKLKSKTAAVSVTLFKQHQIAKTLISAILFFIYMTNFSFKVYIKL